MILSIETSTNACSIALHDKGSLIAASSFHLSKSHSSLLPGIIDQLMINADVEKERIQAIAISEGPGSYTGLRIGSSTAKGISFAWNVPLIPVPTLDILINQALLPALLENVLIIPMLDARRMEVYTKIVDSSWNEIWPLQPLIVEEDTFSQFDTHHLFMIGNGSEKANTVLTHSSKSFIDTLPDARCMGSLAYDAFLAERFADKAYFEPLYLKEFQTKKSRDLLRP